MSCCWMSRPIHLDLEGMHWLEQLLVQATWPWIMISHDRWLLERTTNSIIELNSRYPTGLLLVTGNYTEFLHHRDTYQQTQSQQAQTLAGKVRREEEWLRRGPKARTTKAKYRVDALPMPCNRNLPKPRVGCGRTIPTLTLWVLVEKPNSYLWPSTWRRRFSTRPLFQESRS